jgi:hypothetical protein
MVEILCIMYENEKMRPVATIPGMGGGWIKGDNGRGDFNYDML